MRASSRPLNTPPLPRPPSGSGKSLLIAQAIDLIVGGKAVPSLSPSIPERMGDGSTSSSSSSSVELVAILHEPHLTSVSNRMSRFGIDPTTIAPPLHTSSRDGEKIIDGHLPPPPSGLCGELRLERTLVGVSGGRSRSVCRINGRHVSLRTLRDVAGPLFARVDVGAASAALGRSASRLTMLDTGVPCGLRRDCASRRDAYATAKKCREGIERDLGSRVLPSGLSRRGGGGDGGDGGGYDEGQMSMLRHWVDELGESKVAFFIADRVIFHQRSFSTSNPFASRGGSRLNIAVRDATMVHRRCVRGEDGEISTGAVGAG
jgi:hypothetical protein